jgi:hypothetical protein
VFPVQRKSPTLHNTDKSSLGCVGEGARTGAHKKVVPTRQHPTLWMQIDHLFDILIGGVEKNWWLRVKQQSINKIFCLYTLN